MTPKTEIQEKALTKLGSCVTMMVALVNSPYGLITMMGVIMKQSISLNNHFLPAVTTGLCVEPSDVREENTDFCMLV